MKIYHLGLGVGIWFGNLEFFKWRSTKVDHICLGIHVKGYQGNKIAGLQKIMQRMGNEIKKNTYSILAPR